MLSLVLAKYLLLLQTIIPTVPAQTNRNISNFVFDRVTTGVVFSPFAKRAEKGVIPEWDQYTLQEIKTMYEVVASRFRLTATYGTGANDEKYVYNVSYHQTREKNVLCAEAASLVNKERDAKVLTVLIGVWRRSAPRHMNTEIELAFESAEIANRNFPGTATGVIFTSGDIGTNPASATETLNQITKNKERATKQELKVGTRQDCGLLQESADDEDVKKVAAIFRDIVTHSDFIICNISPERKNLSEGVDAVMAHVNEEVLGYRDAMKKINPYIEVMVETGWPGKGTFGWENVDNLVKYWKLVDAWAQRVNMKVWMFEAFDMPWKQWNSQAAHFGWWKIKRNDDAGKMDGYIEKIFGDSADNEETTKPDDSGTNPGVYIGAVFGALAFCLLIGFICKLNLRVNKLQENLTKEDIAEFVDGISNENAVLIASENGELETALTIPYDKENYEMEKEKIEIKRENLLGSGQFGCVYKAMVETKDGVMTEVALKMAKPGCSKTALKSLLSEIKILTYLGKHANIVSIVGAYTGELGKGVVYVATEICPLGSLEDFLRNEQFVDPKGHTYNRYANSPATMLQTDGNVMYTNQRKISLTDMIRWSHEMACGMEYLGTKNVVHADLSSRNVLLTCDKTAKITDFGLSRRMYEYTNYVKKNQEPLPWRWMAIESLKRMHFSCQSDVWSYGVTLWEIFSMGDIPYPGLSWTVEFVDELESGLRMVSPKYATPEIFHIMVQCWHEDPIQRPTFTALKIKTGELMTPDGKSNTDSYLNLKV